MSRIAIIGAGVGGLAAAVKLSALGHDVEVFESSAFVGGKLLRITQRPHAINR